MKFTFDLQMFGGKGSSQTTQNNYRPLTADELRAQHNSTVYAEGLIPTANSMVDQATKGFNIASGFNPDYAKLYGNQAAATANNTATANNISQGLLPQAFADNRLAQAKTYMQGAMGNLLADNNARGIINSSVTNSGLNGINKNLAEAFTNSYTNDLNTASNLNNNAQNYANMPIQQANQAQNAAYQMPLQLYGAATGQMQPTQQIWQPTLMSNQSNPISSTQSTSGGGGLFSGLMTGLGAYYGAR